MLTSEALTAPECTRSVGSRSAAALALRSRGGSRSARRARYRRRDRLRRLLLGMVRSVKAGVRVAACGRRLTGETGHGVDVLLGPNGASFSGVALCGNVWACPVCSAVIRQRRAVEVEAGLSAHLRAGGGALLVTLTMPHRRVSGLAHMVEVLSAAWSSWRGSRAGRDALAMVGHVGYLRALEVTDGPRGWHPHLHLLVLTDRVPDRRTVAAFGAALSAGWCDAVARRGWDRPSSDVGSHVQVVRRLADAGAYLVKVRDEQDQDRPVGAELVRGDLKSGRSSERITPWDLIDLHAEAVALGDERRARRLAARWAEYQDAMAGRRALVWSKGLRLRLGLGAEASDETVAAAPDETASIVMHLPRPVWLAVLSADGRGHLLEVVESDGVESARVLVQSWYGEWLDRGGGLRVPYSYVG